MSIEFRSGGSDAVPDVEHSTPAIEKIRSCVGQVAKIELVDGRVVVGRFRCTDNGSNVVLQDAFEVRNLLVLGSDEPQKGFVVFVL